MASIQSKITAKGRKVFYVVAAVGQKRKWIRAGTRRDAEKLKKRVESMAASDRLERLGLSEREARIDRFFQDYADYVRMHTSESTVKRYLGIINYFVVFLNMFHPRLKVVSQIKQKHIESYQRERLRSLELKLAADGDKPGGHAHKRLPTPQTVNFEITVLRTAFTWAYDHDLIARIPTKKVKPLKPRDVRVGRILTPEECHSLLETAQRMGQSGDIFVDQSHGWVVVNDGRIIHTSDGGQNWTVQMSEGPRLLDVCFIDALVGWAVGGGGSILHTVDGGATWAEQNSGTSVSLRDVVFLDTFSGWAVGDDGVVVWTDNGGAEWQIQPTPTNMRLETLTAIGNGSAWVGGRAGTVIHFRAGER